MSSGFVTADPSRLTGAGGDLSIEAHSELRGHERSPGQTMLDVELVEPQGSIFMHADQGFDAGRTQELDPRALHSLIRVRHRDHDAVHAGLHDRLGAVRLPMRVRTWLEINVQRATLGSIARRLERLLLSVWPPRLTVIALAGEPTDCVQHHRPHHRIRAGRVIGLTGQIDGTRGPVQVDTRIGRCLWQVLAIYGAAQPRARKGAQGMIDNRIRSMRFSSCLQRLSKPAIATRRCHWRDNRYTSGPFNPVLSY